MEASAFKELKVLDGGEANEENNSALNALINLLPFEMTLPGYKFMGPGTKLAERLERGEVGVNPLDEACSQHDIVYSKKEGNRRKTDQILAEQAFSRMLAGDTPGDERTLAIMNACCMVSKITFEKFFKRISTVIGG